MEKHGQKQQLTTMEELSQYLKQSQRLRGLIL